MLINPNVAIIEALPGVGGDESKLWMEELLASYLLFAKKKDSNILIWTKRQLKLMAQKLLIYLKMKPVFIGYNGFQIPKEREEFILLPVS
ncbi:MAG: PCRF domain-containing protein, partial [Patescibacteria group bacterium]